MVVASLQYGTVTHQRAAASTTDNVMGWIWADPIGWTSVNSANPGSCGTPPCGSYGLNLDTNPASPTFRQINGFAWNDSAGWMCFGSSCAAVPAACGSVPPTGNPGDMKATVDAVGSPAPATVDVRGWANVCNLKDSGWISLNCADVPGGCVAYPHRVKFVPSSGYFGNPIPPPDLASYAWNGNTDYTGYGYMDFRNARLNNPENTATKCSNSIDDDLNGNRDCQELSCSSQPACQEDTALKCKDTIDNNLNGMKDCQELTCRALPGVCDEVNGNTDGSGTPMCANGVDDNGNGLVDCADASCAGYAGCTLVGEATCGGNPIDNLGRPSSLDNCCSDVFDNDGNGTTDCSDVNCSSASMCLPVWLQAKFGNIYAQQGITGASATTSKATYCLTTSGVITGFSSQSGCSEPTSGSLTLPSLGSGYKGTLGSLDINGILIGRYGQVVTIGAGAPVPVILAGKVYRVIGDAILSASIFQNGGGTTRGNGLLFVDGGNLTISGDVGYALQPLPASIRNLASFGVIIRKNSVTGAGGNLFINPTVAKISGAYFVEGTVHTGTSGGAVDTTRLEIFGLIAAHKFDLQRKYRSASAAAETFIFDGRAVANPPPGMQEVNQSLPTSKDAF